MIGTREPPPIPNPVRKPKAHLTVIHYTTDEGHHVQVVNRKGTTVIDVGPRATRRVAQDCLRDRRDALALACLAIGTQGQVAGVKVLYDHPPKRKKP